MRGIQCALVFLACVGVAHCLPGLDREEKLIGWSENYRSSNVRQDDGKAQPTEVIVLSWEPRIFWLRNVLTHDECDHLKRNAEPRLYRSGVVAEQNDGEDVSDIRTSHGMFFGRAEDRVIDAIEQRLSAYTMIPVGNGEGLQVLRYSNGQEYKPHFDYFFHEGGTDNGGNRLATVLMYLESPEKGGETVFPNVPAPASQTEAAGFTPCAMQGLAVRPEKGDAVVFWSLRTDGTLDKGSLHGSCPVLKGTKWAATKWYHVAHYANPGEVTKKVAHVVFRPPPSPAPPGCVDSNPSCVGWAESGECEDNAGFMVGDAARPGACLLSCNRCDLRPLA